MSHQALKQTDEAAGWAGREQGGKLRRRSGIAFARNRIVRARQAENRMNEEEMLARAKAFRYTPAPHLSCGAFRKGNVFARSFLCF